MTTAATDDPVYAPSPVGQDADGTRGGPTTAPAAPASDDVNARFLQFLIPAAATVASTFGPQIGSAIGELVGGSSGGKAGGQIGGAVGNLLGGLGGGLNLGGLFGGRSFLPPDLLAQLNQTDMDGMVSPSVDFTWPMVQQCTLECFGAITPNLVTTLKNMQPELQRGDGARAAESEIAAVERFWPQIASFLTEQVADHLPDIIKKVTSTVMPLLGTRDAAQFTPILTGTEANVRWFLPVLNTVLTTVQQNLPELLDLLSGDSRAARDTAITWQDINVYGRFWDNDFIRVVAQENLPDQNSVQIVLELAPHLSWAKEIQIRDDNGALIKRLHVQDSRKTDEAAVAADQILTNGSLLFAKAKFLGFMTGMYVLPTAGQNELKGKRTTFRWMAD